MVHDKNAKQIPAGKSVDDITSLKTKVNDLDKKIVGIEKNIEMFLETVTKSLEQIKSNQAAQENANSVLEAKFEELRKTSLLKSTSSIVEIVQKAVDVKANEIIQKLKAEIPYDYQNRIDCHEEESTSIVAPIDQSKHLCLSNTEITQSEHGNEEAIPEIKALVEAPPFLRNKKIENSIQVSAYPKNTNTAGKSQH